MVVRGAACRVVRHGRKSSRRRDPSPRDTHRQRRRSTDSRLADQFPSRKHRRLLLRVTGELFETLERCALKGAVPTKTTTGAASPTVAAFVVRMCAISYAPSAQGILTDGMQSSSSLSVFSVSGPSSLFTYTGLTGTCFATPFAGLAR